MITISVADKADLKEILEIQHEAYVSEANLYNDFHIQPIRQTYEEIVTEFESSIFLKAIFNNEIVGSVRVKEQGEICHIAKLIVKPVCQNQGIGTALMKTVFSLDKLKNIKRFELFTGHKSEKNINLYKKLGYREFKHELLNEKLTLIHMYKEV